MLNNLFSKCFNTLFSPLSVSSEPTEHLELSKESLANVPPLSGSPENIEHLELPEGSTENLCTKDEVMNLLQTIDVSKASGPDQISGRMLKATATSVATPVTKLFNQSILTGCFPTMLKWSNIVPIPKNGDKTNQAKYRPIFYYQF